PEGLRQSLSLAGDFGLVVVNVEPGGPAERGGVLLGDILIALDDAAVTDPRTGPSWGPADRPFDHGRPAPDRHPEALRCPPRVHSQPIRRSAMPCRTWARASVASRSKCEM